jgi:hypothetical protein
MKKKVCAAAVITLAIGTTAACSSGGSTDSGGSALTAHGPAKVWLSNNPEELAWGKAMVKAWNTGHPKELVTAQEIPAGKTSEEVIGAAITAGNAPCKNQGTAWDLLKFSTSKEQDGALLDKTGQMPLRKDLGTTSATSARTRTTRRSPTRLPGRSRCPTRPTRQLDRHLAGLPRQLLLFVTWKQLGLFILSTGSTAEPAQGAVRGRMDGAGDFQRDFTSSVTSLAGPRLRRERLIPLTAKATEPDNGDSSQNP